MKYFGYLQSRPGSGSSSPLWIFALGIFLLSTFVLSAHAETGQAAWLRYAQLDPAEASRYSSIPRTIMRVGNSSVLDTAEKELLGGLRGTLRGEFHSTSTLPKQGGVIFVGTVESLGAIFKDMLSPTNLADDGYFIFGTEMGGSPGFIISGRSDRAVLYGVFAFLSKIARGDKLESFLETQNPANTIRMIDQWDNLDGTIERGYAGPSIFFESGHVREDLTRASEYARLLASVGLNICAINNVNANPLLLSDSFVPQLRRIADAFRPWGVRLAISVDVSSPQKVGRLDTFD